MTNLAIFASGRGSNAREVINYFKNSEGIKVNLVISNKAEAGVLEIANQEKIPTKVIPFQDFKNSRLVLESMNQYKIDVIILAGFLLKIPAFLIEKFEDRILNIHPALLPNYGGKGMYGRNVHEAVYNNKEKESGITIHLVNENYDEGKILFQASTEIDSTDDPDDIARKVLELEHYYFPRVIEAFVENAMLDH